MSNNVTQQQVLWDPLFGGLVSISRFRDKPGQLLVQSYGSERMRLELDRGILFRPGEPGHLAGDPDDADLLAIGRIIYEHAQQTPQQEDAS